MTFLRSITLLLLAFAPAAFSIPGGYSVATDLTDERIVAAAQFAVAHLSQSDQDYSFKSAVVGQEAAQLQVKVVRCSQQVVAGMNFREVVMMVDGNGDCIGAFGVQVYDHFGTLSVTRWAREASCDVARAALESDEDFGIDTVSEGEQ